MKEGPQILTFNLAGVKTFISNYLYVKKIQGLNREAKANNAKKNKTAIKAKALYAASSSNYLKEYWENL